MYGEIQTVKCMMNPEKCDFILFDISWKKMLKFLRKGCPKCNSEIIHRNSGNIRVKESENEQKP